MDTEKKLQDAQKRLSDAIAAESFGESDAGALMLEYINDRVSSLINKMIGATPLNDREYLAAHGAVRELQSINSMLQLKASQGVSAREEIDAINEG